MTNLQEKNGIKQISDEDLKRLAPLKDKLYHKEFRGRDGLPTVYVLFNNETKRVEFYSDDVKNWFFKNRKKVYTSGFTIIDPKAIESFKKEYPDSGLDLVHSDSSVMTNEEIKVAYMDLLPQHWQIKSLVRVAPKIFENIICSWEANGNNEQLLDLCISTGDTYEEVFGVPKELLEADVAIYELKRIELCQKMWGEGIKDIKSYEVAAYIGLERIERFTHLYKYIQKRDISRKELLNILTRAETFQALNYYETITLLENICLFAEELDKEPDIETNALKKEHDILLRDYRLLPSFDDELAF